MALIRCSECEKEVSDKASNCPNCGNPINASGGIPKKIDQKNNYLNDKNSLHCPKCDSTDYISIKKGFSGKQAVAGAVLTGFIGILAGAIGSSNVLIKCLKCGYQYKAGDYDKEKKALQQQKKISQKPLNKADTYALILFTLLLSVLGVIFSYNLWSSDWGLFGFIFNVFVSLATLCCIIFFGLGILAEIGKKK